MISAVAARKAALAQAQAQANGAGDSDVAMAEVPEPGPSSSKRKSQSLSSSSDAEKPRNSSTNKKAKKTRQREGDEEDDEQLGGPSRTKRQAKKKKAPKKTPKPASKSQRYFTAPQQDSFEQGEDVIALGGSGSESDSDSLIVGMEDVEEDDADLSSDGLSDDDLMQIDGTLTLSTLFPHTQTKLQQPTTVPPLSTFQPVVGENVFTLSEDEVSNLGLGKLSPSTVVLLPAHDTLCILGTCSITVLHGSITVLGTTLHSAPQAHRVFAPKSSPLPVIRCAFTSRKSSSVPPQVNLPSRIEVDEDVKRHGAVLLFSELRTGVEGLGKICRPFLNVFEPSKWQTHSGSGVLGVRGLSVVYDQLSDTHPFVLPPSWSDALDQSISTNLPSPRNAPGSDTGNVYLVKGPKNAGKSTFAKVLANRLLERYTHVAYLDLDPGQPEYTPPGLISLSLLSQPIFGPSWTHCSPPPTSTSTSFTGESPTIVKSVFLGSTTAKSEVEGWLEGARALWERYREGVRGGVGVGSFSASSYHPSFGFGGDDEDDDEDENQEDPEEEPVDPTGNTQTKKTPRKITNTVPLIINTMGWTKGLGGDLTHRIEEEFGPSDVFAFSSPHDSTPGPHHHPHAFSAYSHGLDDDGEGGYAGMVRAGARVYDIHSAVPATPEGLPGGSGSGSGSGGGRGNQWSGAADQRSMTLLSYFHSAVVPSPSSSPSSNPHPHHQEQEQHEHQEYRYLWDTTNPLVAVRPYNLSLAKAGIRKIVLCGAGSEDVVRGEVGRVLCGSVVGLVALEGDRTEYGANDDDDEDEEEEESEAQQPLGKTARKRRTLPYTQSHPPPSPYTSTCIGLGIVRAVHPRHLDPSNTDILQNDTDNDTETEVDLQLLTPLPPTHLKNVQILVKGEMELPIWGWLDYRAFESIGGAAAAEEVETRTGTGEGEVVVVDQASAPPYLQWGRLGDTRQKGGERRRVRRNVVRRGLM